MKLSSDESRAIAFVLGLIGLAAVARLATRPTPGQVPAAAAVDAGALEEESRSALAGERARARPLAPGERIDVNAAGAAELDRLPGVGAALAARIVAERERGGAFDSAPDLRAVPGIGPAKLERMAEFISFGPGAGLSRRERGGGGGGVETSPDGTGATEAVTSARGARARGGGSRDRRTAAGARGGGNALPADASLDLNRATAAELEALPGVGPALAARILAKRDSVGGFRSVEDLDAVRGIGPAKLARLRPYFRP